MAIPPEIIKIFLAIRKDIIPLPKSVNRIIPAKKEITKAIADIRLMIILCFEFFDVE